MPHRTDPTPPDQILTAAAMRAAEAALIAGGSDVDTLMQRAGRGAADYVWRMAGPSRRVTVLSGPGHNGGVGWVIAETLRQRGADVRVVAAHAPKSAAARRMRDLYHGAIGPSAPGDVLVDCLYGTGLSRMLDGADLALLTGLAVAHPLRIAVDLPSGIATDSGAMLNHDLPDYHLTLALGAWKPAHFLMPASARMGALRLVGIGCAAWPDAGAVVRRPVLQAPAPDAHKYRRGLLGVVAGVMPGAALMASRAGQGAGAGYVKVLADGAMRGAPADLVVAGPDADDPRLNAVLIGPGLGRDDAAAARVRAVLAAGHRVVADADALWLMAGQDWPHRPAIITPHAGEFDRLFGADPQADKITRTRAAAAHIGAVVVHKGPDTVIAAPDGRWSCAPRASSWLSVAGSGDVLAGCIASRLATGADPFVAAGQGVWLQAEAARLASAAAHGGPFSAGALAECVGSAYGACL